MPFSSQTPAQVRMKRSKLAEIPIEHVDPVAYALNGFHRAGVNLDAAAVADAYDTYFLYCARYPACPLLTLDGPMR